MHQFTKKGTSFCRMTPKPLTHWGIPAQRPPIVPLLNMPLFESTTV